MAGLFDIDKELGRLNKQRVKLQKDYDGVTSRLSNTKFLEKASQVGESKALHRLEVYCFDTMGESKAFYRLEVCCFEWQRIHFQELTSRISVAPRASKRYPTQGGNEILLAVVFSRYGRKRVHMCISTPTLFLIIPYGCLA
jgi:hypothetical protein